MKVFVALNMYRGAFGHNMIGIYPSFDIAKTAIEYTRNNEDTTDWKWDGNCYFWTGAPEYCYLILESEYDCG